MGVICDRRLPTRAKGKVYSLVVRPAIMYGLETVAVTKKQVKEMEVAEMKILRFDMIVTRKDKIKIEYIKGTVKVERLGNADEGGQAEVVWTCHEERPGVCKKKGDGNGIAGKEEKKKAEEEIFGCSEGGCRGSWCEGKRHWKQDAVEEHHTLWQPLIKGKAEIKDN